MRIICCLCVWSCLFLTSFSVSQTNHRQEARYRQELIAFLHKNRKGHTAKAIAWYDSYRIRRKLPDPKLRAGLASLFGNKIGEPAIKNFEQRQTTITFDNEPCVEDNVASVREGYRHIRICQLYKDVPIQFLGTIILHELMHWGPETKENCDEYICIWIETRASIEQMLADPQSLKRHGQQRLMQQLIDEGRIFVANNLAMRYTRCTGEATARVNPLLKECLKPLTGRELPYQTMREYSAFLHTLPLDIETRQRIQQVFQSLNQ